MNTFCLHIIDEAFLSVYATLLSTGKSLIYPDKITKFAP